jgi:hypothetical protein
VARAGRGVRPADRVEFLSRIPQLSHSGPVKIKPDAIYRTYTHPLLRHGACLRRGGESKREAKQIQTLQAEESKKKLAQVSRLVQDLDEIARGGVHQH